MGCDNAQFHVFWQRYEIKINFARNWRTTKGLTETTTAKGGQRITVNAVSV
jgi:hypothetical protein